MQDQIEVPQEFLSQVAKLNELLRIYRMAKKTGKVEGLTERVRQKCNQILASIEHEKEYARLSSELKARIQKAFSENKVQTVTVPATHAPSRTVVDVPQNNVDLSRKNSNNGFGNQAAKPAMKIQEPARSVVQQRSKPVQAPPPVVPIQTPIVQPQPIIITPQPQAPIPTPTPPVEPIKPPTPIIQTPKPQPTSNGFISFSSSKEESKPQGISINNISSIQNIGTQSKQRINSQNHTLLQYLEQESSEINLGVFNKKSEEVQQFRVNREEEESQPSLDDQEEKNSEMSNIEYTIDSIIKFCADNRDRLNRQIVFNDDLFSLLRQEEGDFVYLFGVNKPDQKKIQKLYACTLMRFSSTEIIKGDNRFDKEMKDFKNNIRTPIGLVIQGENSACILPEHIKFLMNIQSPYYIVLVLKSFFTYEGVFCTFQESIIEKIRNTPKKQLGQCAQELKKKVKELPFNEDCFPKEKTKFVITKCLTRTIPTIAEEAPNAITISDNECIRQQKNIFSYKFHTKFLVTAKLDYSIYYVNNNFVNARIGFKDFEQFRKEALQMQQKSPGILSITVNRDNSPIRKEFFDILLECNGKRDPYIFINLNNLQSKKTVIVTLKKEATADLINSTEPIQYKNFEKDTVLTYCIHVISKNNYKEFEAEGKVDLIEIKPK